MTKKHFIQIADDIREHQRAAKNSHQILQFFPSQLETLADSFERINPNFNRGRWLSYIAGKVGPNGGAIKEGAA